jgi:ceramide glucosyltransferase
MGGVSVLKPVRGRDREFYQCIRSFAGQEYGEFELLFAVRDPQDPAVVEIQRLAREFPGRRIEVFAIDESHGLNDKVNGLERLRREARYELLAISDSDIRVGPDYLRRVTAPLADPEIGLVTCPYRGAPGGGLPSLLEALWIATDFQASVLVARLLGIEFALGATMVVRRADLERIGGFAPLAGYLADDFWLGQKIHGLGHRIVLSDCAVETVLPREGWRESWRHRVRWGRTLRVCRTAGYWGAGITFAVPLALAALAVAPGMWPWAALAVGLRYAAGVWVGVGRLRDRVVRRWWILLPVADLMSFLVWAASLGGSRVVWRGTAFRLRGDGKLESVRRGAAS